MSKSFRFGSAISLVALATAIAGCAAPQKATGFGGKADGDVGLATRALLALNSNDVPTAISFAERAVEKTPNDAGFRALLGNAYFAGGRFWSAESAYKDALSIYSNQPSVVLKLALVEIALGKNDEAVALLKRGQQMLDPADYGLALALAGQSDAVPVLEAAARVQGAGARVRQNLALAVALSGDWAQARVIAAQDVPANQLDARIQQWMQLARPARASDQVAALTGVKPAPVDQGQPIRLALHQSDTQLAQAAVAEPVPQMDPQVVEAVAPMPAPQPEPAVAPAPPPDDADRKPAIAEASPAPVTMAIMAAETRQAPTSFAVFAQKKPAGGAKPIKVRRAAAPSPKRRGQSNAVVQLGAYSSPQNVTAAWQKLTGRYPALRAYLPMRARYVSPKGVFWRLSIQGFDSQREAIARCHTLRGRGGSCFVRNVAGDMPVQYAAR